MSNTARITIPVDDDFRSQLSVVAARYGFDSTQAMFRYVGKALVDGRRVDFGESGDDWGVPPATVVKAWGQARRDHVADKKAGTVPSFTDGKKALSYLNSL
jgi:hypothetical protein